VAFLVAISTLGSAALASDPPSVEQTTSFWMQKKLEHSQKMLAALATEDFDTLRQSSKALEHLSRIEGFVRRGNARNYRTQLRVFEFANRDIGRMASQKNLDGAALGFTQLTLSCINCHKIVRDTANTAIDPQP
jgi:hypothetical protein